VSVPLCLRAKASPFWIILLLVWANPEHSVIDGYLRKIKMK